MHDFDSDSPECHLAEYWRARVPGGKTDFDLLTGQRAPTARERPPTLDVSVDGPWQKRPLRDLLSEIALCVFKGFPLSRAEYYVAVASGLLVADLSYEDFFRTRWHETDTHRAYGAAEDCARCLREKSSWAMN